MLRDISWGVFKATGNIESFMLYKSLENGAEQSRIELQEGSAEERVVDGLSGKL